MNKVNDKWFKQTDVINLIDSHNKFSDELTLIYKHVENIFENSVYRSIPINKSKINNVIQYESWGSDYSYTNKNLLMLRGNHFLSLSFIRFFELYYCSSNYYTKSNEVVAECKIKENAGTIEKKCYVQTKLLKQYLESTNQVLMFGIQSYRHSERNINEFHIQNQEETFKSSNKNYHFHALSVQNRSSIFHERINSLSIVFGKYYVSIF